MIKYLSCALVLLALRTSAQTNPDSLKALLYRTDDPILQHDLSIQLADVYIYKEPATSLKYAHQARNLSRNDVGGLPHATALNRIGSAHWSMGQLDSSLFYQDRALRISQARSFHRLEARIYGNIGNVYSDAGQTYDAISYASRSLERFTALNVLDRQFAMLNNIGKYFMEIGELDSARYYLKKAGAVLQPEFSFMEPIFLFNLAELNFMSGEFVKSDSLLNVCKSSSQRYGAGRALIRVNQLKAEILMSEGENDEAYKYALEAYHFAVNSRVKDLIVICSRTLSRAYQRTGRANKAIEHLAEHLAYKDSLENRRIRNQLIINKYANEKLAYDRLEQKNTLLESQANFRRTINIILTVLVVVIMLYAYSLYQRRVAAREKNNKLMELNDFKTKLFAVVAHDLRGPVYSLDSLIQLLEDEINSDHPFRPALISTHERVRNLKELLNNLFNWAKDDLEDYNIHQDNFAVFPLLEDMLQSVQSLYNTKNIQISNEVAPNVMVCADDRLLVMVLRNLLTNAIKFSPLGSKVVIKSFEGSKTVQITVKDQGVGMNDRQMSRLFSTETIHTLGTQGEVGSGLGLVLCKDFVERISGSIEVSSEEGKGTSFTITLQRGTALEKSSKLKSARMYHPRLT